jgi:hypothetical protein
MSKSDGSRFKAAMRRALANYDDAVVAADGEPQHRRFEEARRTAEEVVRRFPAEADAHHVAALCWYDSPAIPAEQRDAQVLPHLTRALELDPEHRFARACLACQHFDRGRWEQSLASLEVHDHAFFESIGQRWRNLKSDELRLACRLRLSSASVSPADVEVLAGRVLGSEEVDRPVPLELARTVADLLTAGEEVSPGVAGAVAGLIRRAGFEDALRDEYQEIVRRGGDPAGAEHAAGGPPGRRLRPVRWTRRPGKGGGRLTRSNSDTEMAWINAWDELYELTHRFGPCALFLPDGAEVGFDELKSWLQSRAYQGCCVGLRLYRQETRYGPYKGAIGSQIHAKRWLFGEREPAWAEQTDDGHVLQPRVT